MGALARLLLIKDLFAARLLQGSNLAVEVLSLVADARIADFHTKIIAYFATDFRNKKYVEIAMPLIEQHLEALQNKTGLLSPMISNVWFQQYGQGDYHG